MPAHKALWRYKHESKHPNPSPAAEGLAALVEKLVHSNLLPPGSALTEQNISQYLHTGANRSILEGFVFQKNDGEWRGPGPAKRAGAQSEGAACKKKRLVAVTPEEDEPDIGGQTFVCRDADCGCGKNFESARSRAAHERAYRRWHKQHKDPNHCKVCGGTTLLDSQGGVQPDVLLCDDCDCEVHFRCSGLGVMLNEDEGFSCGCIPKGPVGGEPVEDVDGVGGGGDSDVASDHDSDDSISSSDDDDDEVTPSQTLFQRVIGWRPELGWPTYQQQQVSYLGDDEDLLAWAIRKKYNTPEKGGIKTPRVRAWLAKHPDHIPDWCKDTTWDVDHIISDKIGGHSWPHNYFVCPKSDNEHFGEFMTPEKKKYLGGAYQKSSVFARWARDAGRSRLDYARFDPLTSRYIGRA